ncbi:hypothetical protein [Vulcanisaeta distributa]|uniref:hypothetical protein n=1 Tax=Vulcanisaeta distributa TaxID=164451 RepID=UPI000B1EC21C|nr:hypothetical protein [Vulcanisaeta distributa]
MVYFINSITYLVIAALVIIFLITSAFMVNGIVRDLKEDFRAMINIFRSGMGGVITYIALIMLLISLYSLALGVSISVALVLVLMKILTTLGVIPIVNYGVDVTGVLPAVLPPLACVICVTYVIEGIIGGVRRYAYLLGFNRNCTVRLPGGYCARLGHIHHISHVLPTTIIPPQYW